MKEPTRRTKKAIISNLEKLIGKYGFLETRAIINRYFTHAKEKSKLEKEVLEKERELARLKGRL